MHAGEINESIEFRDQIVTFADDQAVVSEQLVANNPQPRSDVTSVSDSRTHSIIDFLSRPQFLGTFPWKHTDLPNSDLFTLTFPDSLMTTMTVDKLDGFTSFSASVVLQVQVNAQPFQAGRLICAVLPVPELLPESRSKQIASSLSYVTSLPHVQLDISKETEIILKIPYISPYQQYDLVTKSTPWVRFFTKVYSQLSSAGSPTLDVSVWAHFEDIRLGFPTNAKNAFSKSVHAQNGGEQMGPLSGLASAATGVVSGVSRAVKGVLPGVSKFTDPLEGIGNNVTALFKALGFSKPHNLIPSVDVNVRPSQHFCNGDGVDHSMPLTLLVDNKVSFMEQFAGSTADEMTLDYVLKMPNYIGRFTYSDTNTPNQILWREVVHPQYVNDLSDIPGENKAIECYSYLPTTLAYASGFFQYWRGSLVYTFRFVKTNYHSGRVQISFCPFAGVTDVYDSTGKNINRPEYVYKVVVDLREQTEVSVSIPFVSLTPYKHNRTMLLRSNGTRDHAGFPKSENYTQTNDYWFTGTIVVSAITPLVSSNAVVSHEIDCIVEVKAGEDFEVAVPIEPLWFAVDDYNRIDPPPSLTNAASLPEQTKTVNAQSGFASAGTQDIRSSYIEGKFTPQDITGIPSNHSKSTKDVSECIGEKVSSFSELIKRTTWTALCDGSFTFSPYKFELPTVDVTTSYPDPDTYSRKISYTSGNKYYTSMIAAIARMYAFYRGGIRYKFILNKVKEGQPLCEVSTFARALQNGDFIESKGQNYLSYPAMYEQSNVKNVVEAEFPYYSRVNTSVVNTKVLNNNISAITPDYMVRVASNATNILVGNSASDDFRLGFFLGAPFAFPNPTSGLQNTTFVRPSFSLLVAE